MPYKTIGILGGMGPAASASMVQRILAYCQQHFHAVQDTDYPPILLYSMALEGFDESGIVDKEKVLLQLIQGVKVLEQGGSSLIVIACNTVHLFLNELRKEVSIPILNIVEETIKRAKDLKVEKVALLASQTTLQQQLYHLLLDKENIFCSFPAGTHYQDITDLILDVMSGSIQQQHKKKVVSIMHDISEGADAIILGCTELPLAISQQDAKENIMILDSLQILAEEAVKFARGTDGVASIVAQDQAPLQ